MRKKFLLCLFLIIVGMLLTASQKVLATDVDTKHYSYSVPNSSYDKSTETLNDTYSFQSYIRREKIEVIDAESGVDFEYVSNEIKYPNNVSIRLMRCTFGIQIRAIYNSGFR